MKQNEYDIIIAGGGTAGVSCAWNSAKRGLKTLLIEKNTYLGGSMTASLVTPAMKTSDNAINTDFFNALYNKLYELNGAITYCDGNKGWFNPEITKIALDILMKDAGVEVKFEHRITDIKHDKEKILLVYIEPIHTNNSVLPEEMLSVPIESIYYIDATGDAKIFQKLNCEFWDSEESNFQPYNLRFIMSGVNTEKFAEWIMGLDSNRDVTTACRIGDNTYMSTAYTWDTTLEWALRPIFAEAIAHGDLKEDDTNYFQVFSVAGTPDSVAFNAPRMLNRLIDDSKAYMEGRLAVLRLAKFCNKYLPGFEKAYISSIANSLGIRVSNRIRGEYIYTYDDLISGKKFDNPVLISNYPVDIHSDKKDCSTLEKVYKEYQLPLEALKSAEYSNLFAIGRCISADFKAQGALRIIPSCFSMGEGLAKYLADKNKTI